MSKDVFKKVGIGIGMAGLTLFPLLALAQVVGEPIITSSRNIITILANVLTFISGAVLTIALIMLLWAAILFLTAGASETAHTRAKTVLIYAIVGIVVAVLAFSVEPFIRNFLWGR